MIVKHKFVSLKPEQSDPTIIGPNEWNAEHTVIDTGGVIYASDYNFTPQGTGQNLAIGSNQIILNPMPRGLVVGNYLCIMGGTGAMEGVPITGLGSNYVIVTCAYTHTGNWVIHSATGGIQEAIEANNSGTVIANSGTTTLCSCIQIKSNFVLQGAGTGATVLKIGDNLWPSGQTGGFLCAIGNILVAVTTKPESSNVTIRDFTLDANGQNQIYKTYGCIVGVINSSYCTIERVSVINPGSKGISIGGLRLNEVKPPNSLRVLNCQVHGMQVQGGDVGTSAGGIFTQIYGTFVGYNYLDNLADNYLVANGVGDCTFMGNLCLGNTPGKNYCCVQEGSISIIWVGNILRGGFGAAFAAGAGPNSGPSDYYYNFIMIGNDVGHNENGSSYQGINLLDPAQGSVLDIIISGNVLEGANIPGGSHGIMVSSSQTLKRYIIESNIIKGFEDGVHIESGTGLVINQNIIANNRAAGINIVGTSADIVMRDNILYNNSGGNIVSTGAARVIRAPNITDHSWTDMAARLVLEITLVNGANENVDINATYGLIADDLYANISGPTGAFSIGGFNGGHPGKHLTIINFTSQVMTIVGSSGGSLVTNRIITPGNNTFTAKVAELLYDQNGSVWYLLSVIS